MQSIKPVVLGESGVLKLLQYIVFGSLVLHFGRTLFIPLSFALLISFVLYPVCRWLEEKRVSRMLAIVIAFVIMLLLFIVIATLFASQLFSFLQEWPAVQLKVMNSFEDLSEFLNNTFGLSLERQKSIIEKLSSESSGSVLSLLSALISATTSSLVLLVLVPVYAVLILYYRNYWVKILGRLFPEERRESLIEIIALTIKAYYNFIKGMAIVYLSVGVLNTAGLLMLGVPHAVLFGFVASILTFVPYVGIIVGSLLPITMAWITYDSIWYPVGIIAIFTFVQYLEANVIFPLAVSSKLNVNALVMLMAIFAGGILWGMAGMILFVPFVGIAKLLADHNPRWKTVSMILGIENRDS